MLLKGAIKMKRILAIIISVAMIATMLAVSVSAEKEVGGDNGVLTFEPTTPPGEDLNVKVTEITHKYAVDLVYSLQDLVIDGAITWNVNTMKYEVGGNSLENTTRKVKVYNRSDLPVYAYATISNTNDADGITVTAEKDSATNKLTIAKATAGVGASNGTSTVEELVINLTSANWNTVAEYYAAQRLASANQATDTFRIATVTVTITKD